MTKYFIITNFRVTCLSVEILKGYMLIFRNAEGVHGQRKVGNPCSIAMNILCERVRGKFGFMLSSCVW